jgi:hypothetical protein
MIFFAASGVRASDHYLDVRGDRMGERIGQILAASEAILRQECPAWRPPPEYLVSTVSHTVASIVLGR